MTLEPNQTDEYKEVVKIIFNFPKLFNNPESNNLQLKYSTSTKRKYELKLFTEFPLILNDRDRMVNFYKTYNIKCKFTKKSQSMLFNKEDLQRWFIHEKLK